MPAMSVTVGPEDVSTGGAPAPNDVASEEPTDNSPTPDDSANPSEGEGGEEEGGDRPGWLPEKFKTPEEMAAAYENLEKQFTQTRQNQTPRDQVQIPEGEEGEEGGPIEVDLGSLEREFFENGELSDKTKTDLAQRLNIKKELVESFVEGQIAKGQLYAQELFGLVGGEDSYVQMTQWAQANLSREDIEQFNEDVQGDPRRAQLAIKYLHDQYTASTGDGEEPDLESGQENVGNSSLEVYDNWAEVTADMADSRYKANDPSWHKHVQDKLARSKNIKF